MNPILALLRPYIAAAVLALLATAGWWLYGAGEAHVQHAWDTDKLKQSNAAIAQLTINQATLEAEMQKRKEAEVQRDINQSIIDTLSDNIAHGVPVHIPTTCRSAVPSGGIAGAGQNGASGVLSDRVDQLFAELQSRTGTLIKRCDEMNADAIRLNAELPQVILK